VGHAKFYERLFGAMGFQMTALSFSALQWMCDTKSNTGGYIWAKRRWRSGNDW
jgi:hypothetical protein